MKNYNGIQFILKLILKYMNIFPTFLVENYGHDKIQLPIFMHIVTYSNSYEFVMMIMMILIRNQFIHLL